MRGLAVASIVVLAGWQVSTSHASAQALPCLREVKEVTWMRWPATEVILDKWCASVGAPVYQFRPPTGNGISRLLILSWNVHVGGGHLEELLPRLIDDTPNGTGLVVLLQETFRAGEGVSPSYPQDIRVPDAIRPRRPTMDVEALSAQFGLSVAYVPSMRNGSATNVKDREDRGNAVLSTEPLTDVRAIELPFGKERRVAVSALITPRHSPTQPLRVISAHLDTSNDRVAQAAALAERIRVLVDVPLVVGGDLNAVHGFHDGAVVTLNSHMSLLPCGTGRTNRWPLRLDVLAPFVGRLDHLFGTEGGGPGQGPRRSCETLRSSYHSDHLPVLLTLQY